MVPTSLSGSDNISTLQNSRDGVGLDGGRVRVATQVDVVDHHWVKASIVELVVSAMKVKKIKGTLTSEMGAGRSSASATT